MIRMHLGTTSGIATLRQEGAEWERAGHHLQAEDVNVLAHGPDDPSLLYAGTYGHGLFRSADGGERWTKLPLAADYIRAIAFAPDNPHTVYVGTEPANLYASPDRGDTWTDLRIRRLPGADAWRLPYSPRSGALRTLALHAANPALIYGGVEQGGVIKSTDRGDTWSISHNGVHPDVHCLAVDPQEPETVFAATGGGLFRSADSARSWTRILAAYTRAVAIHPMNPQFVIAGPARNVGEGGRLIASHDAGRTWRLATRGLASPLPDMIQEFVIHPVLPGTIHALSSEGQLWTSPVDPLDWRPFAPAVPDVQCLDLART